MCFTGTLIKVYSNCSSTLHTLYTGLTHINLKVLQTPYSWCEHSVIRAYPHFNTGRLTPYCGFSSNFTPHLPTLCSGPTHTLLWEFLTLDSKFTHIGLPVYSPFSPGFTHILHQSCTLFTLRLVLLYSGQIHTLLWLLLTLYSGFMNTVLWVYSYFCFDCVPLTFYSRIPQTFLQHYSHFAPGLLTLFSGLYWHPTLGVCTLSSGLPTLYSGIASHLTLSLLTLPSMFPIGKKEDFKGHPRKMFSDFTRCILLLLEHHCPTDVD